MLVFIFRAEFHLKKFRTLFSLPLTVNVVGHGRMDEFYNSERLEWSGPALPGVFNPRSSFGAILLHCMNQHPEKVAHIYADDDLGVTRADLKLHSIRVLLNLQRLGIRKGDIVTVISGHRWEVTAILFGCVFNGSPFNCLDVRSEKGL